VATPTASVVGVVEGVVEGARPLSPQPAAAAAEEVLVPSQTATVLGVRRPGGHGKSHLPEILEAGENSGVALPRDVGDSEA
jgi:hypothetical protein